MKIVVYGAGAAAISCVRLYLALGAKKSNILMLDSQGVISSDRKDLSAQKKEFAVKTEIQSLQEALKGADVFLGLSTGNIVTKKNSIHGANRLYLHWPIGSGNFIHRCNGCPG